MSTASYSAWQKVVPGDLPLLFSVYNTTQKQTERVAGFRLDNATDLTALMTAKPDQIRIHLGVNPNHNFSTIPDDEPAVEFYLEGIVNNGTNVAYQLDYDPDPKFLDLAKYDTDSGTDEIPPAGAILFARAWMETHNDMIADAFEAPTAKHLVQRVRYYTFSEDETTEILDRLANISSDPVIFLYLGASIPVQGHPFGFRPVLEISSTTASGEDSFFDFSNPCPPVCD